MNGDAVVTLEQQIASVAREIGLRVAVYPKFIEQHRMTQAKADHEIAAMRAVLVTLKSIQENPNATI